MKNRIISYFILLLAVVLLLAGCSGNQAETQKNVNLLFNFPSSRLDPVVDKNNMAVRAGIGETLVKLNDQLQLEPALATHWENIDSHTWKFKIRENVRFHDGSLLKAKDVKSSLVRAMESSKAIQAALKIKSIEANGQELTIRTAEVHPSLPYELVHPSTAVVKIAQGNGIVGTGPFQLASFTPDTQVEVQKYDRYWGGSPKLDSAVIRFNSDGNARTLALQSKEADIAYHIPAEMIAALKNNPELRLVSTSGMRNHYLIFNMRKPLFRDLEARKSVDALIPREEMVKTLFHGTAEISRGPFHSSLPFANASSVNDGKDSVPVLAEVMKKHQHPLKLTLITYPGRPELPLMAQVLQQEARKQGIQVQIRTVDNIDEYLSQQTDWDLAMYSSLTAPRGDAGYFFNSSFLPEGALNYGKIDHPALTEKIRMFNQTLDEKQRQSLAGEIVQIIKDEALQLYMIHPHTTVAYGKHITSWKPSRTEYYILTHQMDVRR
ncbi:ABC transporter substrate-binding protein [Lihuaxuella thermophila]|uniref:Peptide/nickel transport system substrate-binding protein n=1 Tax=Lihuaxuella thermophila TaxID=1173111 RepID=A0A1H8BI83_9BACL|nr:ABC transporter substrate-binding protein [Lihuaxuella thermophila]SEM82532.1 peptide/nickel transport system substrate-binding protein [Lihuaxuella thermophila]